MQQIYSKQCNFLLQLTPYNSARKHAHAKDFNVLSPSHVHLPISASSCQYLRGQSDCCCFTSAIRITASNVHMLESVQSTEILWYICWSDIRWSIVFDALLLAFPTDSPSSVPQLIPSRFYRGGWTLIVGNGVAVEQPGQLCMGLHTLPTIRHSIST